MFFNLLLCLPWYRDAALQEMDGYDEYGLNAPKCLLGADGKPLEEQPRGTGALAWSLVEHPLIPGRCAVALVHSMLRRMGHTTPPFHSATLGINGHPYKIMLCIRSTRPCRRAQPDV